MENYGTKRKFEVVIVTDAMNMNLRKKIYASLSNSVFLQGNTN